MALGQHLSNFNVMGMAWDLVKMQGLIIRSGNPASEASTQVMLAGFAALGKI